MRGQTHTHKARQSLRAIAGMTAALLAASAISGCSTNLTGFDFPSFGLLKKDRKDAQEPLGPAGIPPQTSKLDSQ